MRNKEFKIWKMGVVLAVVALAMVVTLKPPHQLIASWSKSSGIPEGAKIVPSFEILEPGDVFADTSPSGAAAMAGPFGNCAGSVTLNGGTFETIVPCAAAYTQCFAVQKTTGTPGAVSVACAPTQTATVVASATVTVAAVIFFASTANATPVLNYVMGPR